jgi:hypothetical protein
MTTYDRNNYSKIKQKRMIVRDYEKKQKRVNGVLIGKSDASKPYFDIDMLKLHLKIYQYSNPNNLKMNIDFREFFDIKEIKLDVNPKKIKLKQ